VIDHKYPELRVRSASYYHKDTGILSDYHVHTDGHGIALNTPADHVAIEGAHDHLSKRVDHAAYQQWETLRAEVEHLPPQERSQRQAELDAVWALVLLDYQPPQPSADHEWNATAKRWQPSASALAKQQARAAALAQIAALEAQGIRPMREALLGIDGAKERTASIDSQITALRASL
jgi:hypothetical protein